MTTKRLAAEQKLINEYFNLFPDEAANHLSNFKTEEILEYLKELPIDVSVKTFEKINPDVAANLLLHISDDGFKKLFSSLDPNLAAHLLSRLNNDDSEKKLSLLWAVGNGHAQR